MEDAIRLVDESEGLALWRARFALWRNRPDVARGLLATIAPNPQSRCLEAIAFVLEGDLAQGETRLRELVETDVRGEAWTWLATVLRKQGRFSEAVQAAEAAAYASAGFNLIARLERELAVDYRRLHIGSSSPRSMYGRLMRHVVGDIPGPLRLRRIGELETASALSPLGLKPGDSIAAVETVLERFAGNHSTHLTTTEHGRLHAYRIPEDPRQLGANVQNVLWTRGADAARAVYEELAPRVDDHPLFRIYHGELELWMGEYEKAERIFRMILDRNDMVRWAWIGLGASVMLQGDLAQAQKIWTRGLSRMRQRPGPTLYVYRGECYRRQGELTLARTELETGLRLKPRRLSARINLALLDHDPAALEQVANDCAEFAPMLMAQLNGSTAERLEQVLVAMRGNRSSSEWGASYHLWGRVWRRGVE